MVRSVFRLLCALFALLSLYLFCHLYLHTDIRRKLGVSKHDIPDFAANVERLARFGSNDDIPDFAAKGKLFASYGSLAESIEVTKSDIRPLLSRLREHFPWWKPLPTVYTPWTHKPYHQTAEKGIVICAGSSNVIYATHLVLSLRNVLNSELPIQIAYAGDSDLSFADRFNILDLGPDIDVLDLLDHFDDEIAGLRDGGWAMKPFAMLASRFRKTILLDADAMFVRSPDNLFDTEPGLAETGTLFWHDRAFNSDSEEPLKWVQSLIGDRQPSVSLNSCLLWQNGLFHEMDSAAVLMDKGRPKVFMSILFAAWMNLRGIRNEVTYRHVHGDKETFWLACELSDTPYYYNPVYAGIIGAPEKTGSSETSLVEHKVGRLKDLVAGIAKPDTSALNEEVTTNTKEEIQAIAELVVLREFTHWMPGALNWSSSTPDYSVGTVTSCLDAKEDTNTLNDKTREVLSQISELAREADERYYGFDQTNVTLLHVNREI